MLRLFSSRPNSRASSRPSSRNGNKPSLGTVLKTHKDVSVRLLLNSHGAVIMTQNRIDTGPADVSAAQYADGQLTGEVEINVARGSGRKRCRAIRIRLQQVARLHMGKERGWERDVLFERTIENRGAIILEEGVQRFKFTMAIPYSVAPFDIHPTGDIRLHLTAEVEGLTGSGAGPLSRRLSEGSEELQFASYLRRGSSTEVLTPPEDGPPAIDIRPTMTVSWNDPVSSSDEEIPWMKGSAVAARCICLIYNPDPTGGINSLDMRQDGVVPGLGIFDSRLASDVWTVCALLRTTLSFPDPSPAATIYYVRTVLEQRAATTSPRDPEGSKPIVSMTPFAVWEKGVRPPKVPTRSSPAVWRGRQAGGSDTGTLQVSGIGRLPNDETGRPSTLPGIITPIHVDHELAIEVFYSIDGEDVAGNPLAKGQPPGVRLLRIVKPTIVPSCGCIPEALELPSYDQLADCAAAAVPCPTCKLVPNEQVCRTCDLTTLLHPRHDLFQYGPNGVCPDCDKRFLQSDEKSKWKDCACGLNLGDMWERMASVMPPDVESVVGSCSAWPDSKRDGSNTPPTPP